MKRRTACLKSLLLSLVFVKALDTKPRTNTEASLTAQLRIRSLLHALLTLLFHLLAVPDPTFTWLLNHSQRAVAVITQRRLKPSELRRVRSGNGRDKQYKQPSLAGFMLGMALLFRRAPTLLPCPPRVETDLTGARGSPEPCRSCGACEGLRGEGFTFPPLKGLNLLLRLTC